MLITLHYYYYYYWGRTRVISQRCTAFRKLFFFCLGLLRHVILRMPFHARLAIVSLHNFSLHCQHQKSSQSFVLKWVINLNYTFFWNLILYQSFVDAGKNLVNLADIGWIPDKLPWKVEGLSFGLVDWS